MPKILFVDKDDAIRKSHVALLKNRPFDILTASSSIEAMELIHANTFNVVATEMVLEGPKSGLDVLRAAKDKDASTEVLIYTAHQNIKDAIESTKKGAFDYIDKGSYAPEILLSKIEKALRCGERRKDWKSRRPAYLVSASLENIRCFGRKQTIDLSDVHGRPAHWTVILGSNGRGKTTLLQALAMLTERESEYTPIKAVWLSSVQKEKNTPSIISGGFSTGARLNEDGKDTYIEQLTVKGRTDAGSIEYSRNIKFPVGEFVIYGYGAARRMGDASLTEKLTQEHGASLFDDNALLFNAEEWLLQLDYSANKLSPVQEESRKKLNQVKEILISILPDVDDIRFLAPERADAPPKLQFNTLYGGVSMNDLSLGYKTLIAWMVDLTRRLFRRYPESDNPISEPAIVLIDEIDLHLHPGWQRELMNFLSRRFTNTQFIVTAHSPLVVQAAPNVAGNVNLVVLKHVDDHVIIEKQKKTVKGWRADQILASELFDISTYPEKIEKLREERAQILSKGKLFEEDKQRLEELELETGFLPATENPRDIEAMEIIHRAAQKLKKGDSL